MSEWKEFTIEQLGKVITGKTPSKNNPEEWGDNYNFITPSDYGAYNKFALSSIRKLSDIGYVKHNQFNNMISEALYWEDFRVKYTIVDYLCINDGQFQTKHFKIRYNLN